MAGRLGVAVRRGSLLVVVVLLGGLVQPSAGMASSSAAPLTPDPGAAAVIARYQERIPQLMEQQDVPGLALAVVDGDQVLWEQGFGTTGRGGGTPVTTDTIFSVQSMSKLFTATAVMQAVGDGLLDLDVPITTYLPGFTVHSAFEDHPERKITLRMLLSHTAGFTHEAPYGNNYDLGEDDFDAHVASISNTWLRFPVGTGYAYSNLGIDLAGAILAKARREPFAAAMQDSLLGPLAMDHSTFDQARILATTDRAVGHVSVAVPPVITPMAGAGGLYASAADLASFLRFQLGDGVVDGRTVLDPSLMQEMRTIPAPSPGADAGYALGVARTHWRAGRYLDLFSHGGGGFGFLSDLWWLPQLQLGIAVLTNSSDHELQGDLALSILRDLVSEPGSVYHDRLLAQPIGHDVVEPGRFEPPPGFAQEVLGASMAPTGDEAARWSRYIGTYRPRNWGVISPDGQPDEFAVVNGVPYYSTGAGDARVRLRLVEVEPGLFLAGNGETLDFRAPRPTYASIDIYPTTGGPSTLGWLVGSVFAAAAVWWLLGGLASSLLRTVRRRRGQAVPSTAAIAPRWWRRAVALAGLVAVTAGLATLTLLVVMPGLVDSGFLGWLAFPLAIRLALHAPLVLAVGAVTLVGLLGVATTRGWWRPRDRPRLAALTLAAALLAVQAAAWGLVGWGFG